MRLARGYQDRSIDRKSLQRSTHSLTGNVQRPAIWKCPAEITDYVEDLIWKTLSLQTS